MVAQFADGVLQTFSFVLLCFGIVKIRSFIVQSGMRNQINTRMIVLQSIAFGSYLIANVLLYVEIIVFSNDQNKTKGLIIAVLLVYIVANFLAFVTQFSLIVLFLEIGKKKENTQPKQVINAVSVVDEPARVSDAVMAFSDDNPLAAQKRFANLHSVNVLQTDDNLTESLMRSTIQVEDAPEPDFEPVELSFDERMSEKIKV